jgi:DHA1 family tetracycline resistance protein-like MFS transporter
MTALTLETPEQLQPAPQASPPRNTQLFLLCTIFLNALGMTIVGPVMPFVVQQYVADGDLAGVIGWLTAIYAICQFVAAPGLGVLSDRFGRRPLTLVCLIGSALGYLVFGIGGALWVLFLGRIVDGLTGANFSILAAYIGDTTTPEERGKLFGRIGGIGGVGMIVGPVLGGFAAVLGYTAPLYLAAAILLLNTVWGFFAMPESLPLHLRSTQLRLSELNPLAQLAAIFRIARLRWLVLTGVLYYLPFAIFVTELAVLAKDQLGWGPEQIGLGMLLIGCVDIVMQGVLSARLVPILGEVRMTAAGLVCEAAAYVLIGALALVHEPMLMLVGLFLFAFGSGLLEPALGALTSTAATQREQGVVQGGNQALRSLTQIVGPLLAGALYSSLGGEVPYWLGAAILLLGVVTIGMAARMQPADGAFQGEPCFGRHPTRGVDVTSVPNAASSEVWASAMAARRSDSHCRW